MRLCVCFASLGFLGLAPVWGQAAGAAPDNPPIVQPGAPGQSSRTLSSAAEISKPKPPAAVDISFMQGMIMHHSQAVEMTDLLRTRSRSKELQALGKRISISQTDEIKFMKQWLEDRGQPTTMQHQMGGMAGMDHMNMGSMDHSKMDHSKMENSMMASMPLMPGMLTPQQMKALEQASGPAFDHLFLTGMIQHHTGALTMVQDLFDTPGSGQDPFLFDFATDVDNTQRAEIEIMKGMLRKEKK